MIQVEGYLVMLNKLVKFHQWAEHLATQDFVSSGLCESEFFPVSFLEKCCCLYTIGMPAAPGIDCIRCQRIHCCTYKHRPASEDQLPFVYSMHIDMNKSDYRRMQSQCPCKQ